MIENNGDEKVLGVVQSEDGEAFVRRMMKERGITRNPEGDSSLEKAVVDQISEKDNKGPPTRQPSPDNGRNTLLQYETGGEEHQYSRQRLGTAELLPKHKKKSKKNRSNAAPVAVHQERAATQ